MKARVLSVILILGLLIAQVNGAYESQTLDITDTEDDGFITASGNIFDSATYVYTTEASQDIRSFWVFDDVHIESSQKLNNATLRIRSGNTYDFDADNSFTLKGLELQDLQDSWRPLGGMIITLPQTSAYVNVNTSNWYGYQWHEITVTNIVKEIISHYAWNGDGLGTGDSIGFIGLGAQDETRGFYDYSGSSGYSAQLIINFGDDPAPPPTPPPAYENNTWEFINTTERVVIENNTVTEIDIFKATEYGNVSILLVDSDELTYFNTTTGDPNRNDWAGATVFDHQEAGSVEFIASLNGWTYLMGRNGTRTFIYYSDDEFLTWGTDRINSNYGLSATSSFGSIWPDQTGRDLIHVVWSTLSAWSGGKLDIVYSNFTIDTETGNLTWAPSYTNITVAYGDDQVEPDLYQERDGTLHISWTGKNGTANDVAQYRRRQANGTWLNAVMLSGDNPLASQGAGVVANEITGVALVAWTRVEAGAYTIRWDTVFPNNTVGSSWGTPDEALSNARYVSMVNDRDANVAHLAYVDYNGDHIEYRSKLIDNSTVWSASSLVSSQVNRHFYPVISLDETNDTLAIIWWGLDDGDTWYTLFQVGDAPPGTDTLLHSHPFRYPSNEDYFSRSVNSETWWLVYPNGTIVGGPYDSLTDALEGLDDLIGSDPDNPDPPGQDYPQTGPFTRFRTRLYILVLGIGCFVGPVIIFAMKKGSLTGGMLAGGLIVMLMGLGLMLAIRGI